MKPRTKWVLCAGVAVAVALFALLRRPSSSDNKQPNAANANAKATSAVPSAAAAIRKTNVVIQTGQERMSNAIRCMAFMMDMCNNTPTNRNTIRSRIGTVAGVLFFQDCLMAKMSHGYITISSNELRQDFSNAVAQVFSNNIPPSLLDEIKNHTFEHDNSGQSLNAMYLRDKKLYADPYLSLADGFSGWFTDRNNLHMSVDDQYQRMADSPQLARTLTVLGTAFQQAGIKDAEQSDLRELCLDLGELWDTARYMYGPQQEGGGDPAEYKDLTDLVDKTLQWRLTNMCGLDDATAQALVKSVSRVPVSGFSRGGLQVPAFIQ